MKSDTLVILSLPFQRLIRSHLSPMILEILTKRSDVVIVSPFAEHPDFLNQYTGERITHAISHTNESLPRLFRQLVAISSILRKWGYKYRNRKRLPYYWATRHMVFGENGNDTVVTLPKRMGVDILAWFGSWPRAWVILDSLIGRACFNMPHITNLASSYDRVTLIQAASWGFQDEALAWMGRKYQWRTVLLPYTTDQIFCNGYLYSDFDAVCVQGMAERKYTHVLHDVPAHKVINLGSTYMRALEAVAPTKNDRGVSSDITKKNKVMYAGLTPTYFPTACEVEAVNMLSSLNVGNKVQSNIALVYRPAVLSPKSFVSIRQQLLFPERVELQTSSPTSLGLTSYSPTDTAFDIDRLCAELKNVDVMVTSMETSLSLEAALMGVPSIAYYPEDNAVLHARRSLLLLNKQNHACITESIPVAKNLQELASLVNQLLNHPVMRSEIVEATLRDWDYSESNYPLLLEEAVFGNS